MSDDARQQERQPALKGAVIRAQGNPPLNCLITNLSPEGAELTVEGEVRLPQHFVLDVPHESASYRASVRWREPGRLGVGFDSKQVSAKPHLRVV